MGQGSKKHTMRLRLPYERASSNKFEQAVRSSLNKRKDSDGFLLIGFGSYLDLRLLEHNHFPPIGINALNGESIIRYLLSVERTEWKKGNETRDGY